MCIFSTGRCLLNVANILIFSENTAFSLKKKYIWYFLREKKKKKKYFRMLLAPFGQDHQMTQ